MLSAYARAMQCPVLGFAIALRPSYAMSGALSPFELSRKKVQEPTIMVQFVPRMLLRVLDLSLYALSGTDLPYPPTGHFQGPWYCRTGEHASVCADATRTLELTSNLRHLEETTMDLETAITRVKMEKAFGSKVVAAQVLRHSLPPFLAACLRLWQRWVYLWLWCFGHRCIHRVIAIILAFIYDGNDSMYAAMVLFVVVVHPFRAAMHPFVVAMPPYTDASICLAEGGDRVERGALSPRVLRFCYATSGTGVARCSVICLRASCAMSGIDVGWCICYGVSDTDTG
eukprot:2282858-Rhodomonas_salina.1